MTTTIRRFVSTFAAAVLGVTFLLPAHAGLLGTDQVAGQQGDRERVQALASRPEIARKMQDMGVAPDEVQKRLNAMTESELSTLAGRLDSLPAGAMSDTNWLIIIVIILLLVLVL